VRDVCGADLGTTRPAVKYLIPDGYVGWLRVDYGVNDSRPFQYGLTRVLPLGRRRRLDHPSELDYFYRTI
jgi:hypothetical protein